MGQVDRDHLSRDFPLGQRHNLSEFISLNWTRKQRAPDNAAEFWLRAKHTQYVVEDSNPWWIVVLEATAIVHSANHVSNIPRFPAAFTESVTVQRLAQERNIGFEPMTTILAGLHSTAELISHLAAILLKQYSRTASMENVWTILK